MPVSKQTEQTMIAAAVEEVSAGMTVNVGFGWPMRIMPALFQLPDVMIHAENGILGIGPPVDPKNGPAGDPDIINPAGAMASLVNGASVFDSTHSFALIRRGKIDIAFLGALQVSHHGDLASWSVPGKRISGMGGGRELAYGAKRVIVMMEQSGPDGSDKLLDTCTFPLTAAGVVDTLITERGVYRKNQHGVLSMIKAFE